MNNKELIDYIKNNIKITFGTEKDGYECLKVLLWFENDIVAEAPFPSSEVFKACYKSLEEYGL